MARKKKGLVAKKSKGRVIEGVTKSKTNPFEIRKQKIKQQVLNSNTRGTTLQVGKSRSAAQQRVCQKGLFVDNMS